MRAYVLINVQPGKSNEVAHRLKQIPGVISAESCWGRPDIVAQVQAEDLPRLGMLVLATMQSLPGVESTDTHIVIESGAAADG